MFLGDAFWIICAGMFGAVVGSFLNALIYRLPRESLSVAQPKRSFCPVCGKTIPWYDNLPIISYILLSGRCRFCGTRISLRYPLIEALTSSLFICLALAEKEQIFGYDPDRWRFVCIYILHLYFIAAAIAVTFIDIDFQIIPDEITFSGAIAAPIVCVIFPELQQHSGLHKLVVEYMNPHVASLISSIGGAVVGGGSLMIVGVLGKMILKKEALGMGDVKLMAFFGGFFGLECVLLIFFLGCAFGSVVGVPMRLLAKKQEIPFGPFLSIGAVLILFFREDIYDFICNKWLPLTRSLVQ